jgi:hypothetical protein
MEITKEEANRLKESQSGITGLRRQSGHLLHKLIDALVIGLTTVVLSGTTRQIHTTPASRVKPACGGQKRRE